MMPHSKQQSLFREDEYQFVQQCHDWLSQSSDEYRPILTPFLNPREQYILKMVGQPIEDLNIFFDGGSVEAESQRAIITPEYFSKDNLDFEMTLFQIDYPIKFTTLSHPQILGALLGLGLQRKAIGDILNDEHIWQVMVDKRIFTYIQQNFVKVGHTTVKVTALPLNKMIDTSKAWEEQFLLVSSLRLDTLVAASYHLSRVVAKQMIESGQVRLNWIVVEKPDSLITINDIVSVHHYGRFQLKGLDGRTKKDKIKAIENIIRR